jgi:hypothetical protein
MGWDLYREWVRVESFRSATLALAET